MSYFICSREKNGFLYVRCRDEKSPEQAAEVLDAFYLRDREKTARLLSLGDISYLGSTPDLPRGVVSVFDIPEQNPSIAESRDRLFPLLPARTVSSLEEMKKICGKEKNGFCCIVTAGENVSILQNGTFRIFVKKTEISPAQTAIRKQQQESSDGFIPKPVKKTDKTIKKDIEPQLGFNF